MVAEVCMAEERADIDCPVFFCLFFYISSKNICTLYCIFSDVVAEVCMAEEERAGQYWHSSLDRRVGDTWINGGSEACITIHN